MFPLEQLSRAGAAFQAQRRRSLSSPARRLATSARRPPSASPRRARSSWAQIERSCRSGVVVTSARWAVRRRPDRSTSPTRRRTKNLSNFTIKEFGKPDGLFNVAADGMHLAFDEGQSSLYRNLDAVPILRRASTSLGGIGELGASCQGPRWRIRFMPPRVGACASCRSIRLSPSVSGMADGPSRTRTPDQNRNGRSVPASGRSFAMLVNM
jgi:hypothetical protein